MEKSIRPIKGTVFNVIIFIILFLFSSSVYGELNQCFFTINGLQNAVNNQQDLILKKIKDLEEYFDHFSAKVKEYTDKMQDREFDYYKRRYFELERDHAAYMANRYGERIANFKALLMR